MKDWDIQKKVFTIIVDSASSNDATIWNMRETIQRSRKLACGGILFYVRCRAHDLNLCLLDGLGEIEDIISDVRESVEYINRSYARRMQQYYEAIKLETWETCPWLQNKIELNV